MPPKRNEMSNADLAHLVGQLQARIFELENKVEQMTQDHQQERRADARQLLASQNRMRSLEERLAILDVGNNDGYQEEVVSNGDHESVDVERVDSRKRAREREAGAENHDEEESMGGDEGRVKKAKKTKTVRGKRQKNHRAPYTRKSSRIADAKREVAALDKDAGAIEDAAVKKTRRRLFRSNGTRVSEKAGETDNIDNADDGEADNGVVPPRSAEEGIVAFPTLEDEEPNTFDIAGKAESVLGKLPYVKIPFSSFVPTTPYEGPLDNTERIREELRLHRGNGNVLLLRGDEEHWYVIAENTQSGRREIGTWASKWEFTCGGGSFMLEPERVNF